MRTLAIPALLGALVLGATACSSGGQVAGSGEMSGTTTDNWTSRYNVLALAATRKALDRKLISQVDPRVVRLRVQGPGEAMLPADGPVEVVDLLTRRGRRAIQADVFRQPDGQWFAGQWSQCTD